MCSFKLRCRVCAEDYEQLPQTDRDQLMVHVFYYLNGLDGTMGDLMALPRSQNAVMERGAFSSLWQDFELPGSLSFGTQIPLPPGSAVIVHSALMHGRRAMVGFHFLLFIRTRACSNS